MSHVKNDPTSVLGEIDHRSSNVACTYIQEAQILTNYRFGEVIDVNFCKGK